MNPLDEEARLKPGESDAKLVVEILTYVNPSTPVPLRYAMPQQLSELQDSRYPILSLTGLVVNETHIEPNDANIYFLDERLKLCAYDVKNEETTFENVRGAVLTHIPIRERPLNRFSNTNRHIDDLVNHYHGIAVSFKRGTLYKPHRLQQKRVEEILHM